MKKLLFFVVVVFCFSSISAQQVSINNFTRLESVGKLPNDLLNIAKGNNFDGTKPKNDIQKSANRYIKDLILSGNIVYGDTVTHYLEKILDNLLVNEPALRKEIKIYTLKSSEVNAFATIDGFVFVTVGFISQSTCEAEIAYVLSHELIHYVNKHGYKKNGDDDEKFNTIEDYLKCHSRSREQEFECDKLGYERFYKNSGYSNKAIDGMFDILQYSYLPFDEIKLNRGMFENDYYKFDNNYFLESVTPIASREDYIDTFSTHPNLKSRRNEMESLIGTSIAEGKKFIQSEDKFNFIRTISRFQTINQQIIADNYIKAYYNSLILEKEYPNNEFLLTAQIASIYGISKVKTYGSYSTYLPSKNNTEGEMQFIANLFEKMNKKETAIMALRYSWKGISELKNKKYFKSLFNDILNDMQSEMNLGNLTSFSDYKFGEEIKKDTIDDKEEINSEKKTKYDRVKKKKLVGHQPKFKTENYMLGDLKKDDKFVKCFEEAINYNESKSAKNVISNLSDNKTKGEKIKLLVFEPTSKKVENQESSSMSSNIKLSNKLSSQIESITKTCNIEAKIIPPYDYDSTISYQTRARIHDFAYGLNRFGEIFYENRDIDNIKEDIGGQYINLVSFRKKSSIKSNIKYKLYFTGLSLSVYPFIPLSILQWIPNKYNGTMNSIIYDIDNNQYLSSKSTTINYENTSDMEKEALYKSYKQDKKSIGFLGKRFLVGFDLKLSPAWFTSNYEGKHGGFCFDYDLSPNIEFVINKSLTMGVGYHYFKTKFDYVEDDFSYSENSGYNSPGDISVSGFNLFFKTYIDDHAPLGYYYKCQIDVLKYKSLMEYYKYIGFQNNQSIYQYIDTPETKWTAGLRLEFGKTVFVNNYVYLGFGASAGILFGGWKGMTKVGFDPISISDMAAAKLLRSYTWGLNLSIGFLPF